MTSFCICGLAYADSIHSSNRGAEAEPVLSNRMMTCAACSRLLAVDDDGTLPEHQSAMDELFEEVSGLCPGSYTKAHPHRMLPEASRRLSFIELVPDAADTATSNRLDEIMQCATFMRDLAELGREQLAERIDTPLLVGIVQQTSRARTAALGLIR